MSALRGDAVKHLSPEVVRILDQVDEARSLYVMALAVDDASSYRDAGAALDRCLVWLSFTSNDDWSSLRALVDDVVRESELCWQRFLSNSRLEARCLEGGV